MKKSGLVVCVGELLIDFFCTDIDVNLVAGSRFVKQAGGAPANVCAAISRLGGKSAFVGKVGNDSFGVFLKQTLDDESVDTNMLLLSDEAPTTIAFVSLQANGERDFVFNRGADQHLTYEEIDRKKVKEGVILHFGSATALLNDPFQSTYIQLLEDAKENHSFVSFDPNFRSGLWEGREEEFVSLSKKCISMADFVKVSEEELELITQTSNKNEALQILHQLGAKLIAVTLGKDGTLLSNGQQNEIIGSMKIKSIDSTGAGDAFVGATLYQLSQVEAPKTVIADFAKIKDMIVFSNTVGAIVCTKLGAISSLPRYQEVKKLLGKIDAVK
ncbi:carbohydrate kinase [Anaerobacillus sp. CMMVII]|uniref:carbohydrate kinase family protein n=1 Tax=Anaerobacillus sp. CMMVII TaxID=2755588 RepID=UPI0021B8403F|nr:carbohydrate kinase [Anaerobacillus sp. CMMVII]MCT8137130.1 carbohydrate kinase [Anaerobacillus sp. CMMVII]